MAEVHKPGRPMRQSDQLQHVVAFIGLPDRFDDKIECHQI